MRSSTSTGCGSTRSRRCSTWTTRGKDGEWAPNKYGGRENLEAISFLQEVNATAYKRVPGIMMIAEESTAWPGVSRPTHLGGLGFGFKWNMGWMNDTLEYFKLDPIYRQYHHNEITFSMVYAFSENYVLPLSHDEVVHGKGSLLHKMPGDEWRQFAGLRALFGYMWAHPGKQLLFMGSEFGQGNEWSETNGLDWWVLQFDYHSGVQRLVRDLNTVYRSLPTLWSQDTVPDGFSWIDSNDAHGNVAVVPALRRAGIRRARPRLRRQLLRDAALRLPGRAAARGPLARGAQHRRGRLRRQRHGQPGHRARRYPSRGTAGPRRRRSSCRRCRFSGWPRRSRAAGPFRRAEATRRRGLGDAARRPLALRDGGQDRGERGAHLGGGIAVSVFPLGLRHHGIEPGGDGLTFPGLAA